MPCRFKHQLHTSAWKIYISEWSMASCARECVQQRCKINKRRDREVVSFLTQSSPADLIRRHRSKLPLRFDFLQDPLMQRRRGLSLWLQFTSWHLAQMMMGDGQVMMESGQGERQQVAHANSHSSSITSCDWLFTSLPRVHYPESLLTQCLLVPMQDSYARFNRSLINAAFHWIHTAVTCDLESCSIHVLPKGYTGFYRSLIKSFETSHK